ncbi:hypothetical protein [Sulfurimonas indica]|uniref:hypothetical protein n=1 Tax=Sulfurimonas TaxID=202746 RepID=UPI0012646ABA|nr:hypothetical protein [Sulfurimonas indica]
MNNSTKKFHVGRFSATDSNGALVVNAKVEKGADFVDAVFWMECHPFSKDEKYISVAFDAVSLRSFASQLKELQYQSIQSVKKYSGGQKMTKSIEVSIIEKYSSFQFKENDLILLFRIPTTSLIGLADQIIHLANTTMDATYKTQQFIEKQKNKKASA